MFKRISNVSVESDEGYSFRKLEGGRGYRCEYREGERSLVVYCEIGASSTIVDMPQQPLWQPPYESDPISQPKVEQIVQRIKDVYRFWGGSAEVFLSKPDRLHKKDERTVEDPGEFELLKLSDEVYVYRAGEKSMVVNAWFAPDPNGGPIVPWINNKLLQHWSPPHESERISETQVAVIQFHLQRGLRILGYSSVVFELANGKKLWMS